VARAHRYDRQLALIVLDIDDFKAINDRIGHLAGDGVLAETADRVREAVRSADVACRVGGDEFAVILPESTTDDADQLYHRLRGAISSRPVAHAGRLFVSAGIAELVAADDPTAFFERADEALYRAKELGKGQVVEASRLESKPEAESA
jgi:two-component system cell cycle response regulator